MILYCITLVWVRGEGHVLLSFLMFQVRAILGDTLGWTLTSRDVDLPELQGEPEEIARDKCQLATEKVRSLP